MTQTKNLQDLQQENGTLLTTKIMDSTTEEMKMMQPLNLIKKPLKVFNLCDYSDAYVLVTQNIKVANVAANTKVAFKNCAIFTSCVTC